MKKKGRKDLSKNKKETNIVQENRKEKISEEWQKQRIMKKI